MKREIKEDIRIWKDLLCSWISRIDIVNMAILTKAIYVSWNSYKNSNDILHWDRKINLKIHMETKILKSQSNSEHKVQHWRCHNTWVWTILQKRNNKSSMILAQKQTQRPRPMEEYTRSTKSTLLQPTDYWKRSPKPVWKNNLFNKCCWKNWISTCSRGKEDPCLSP
jgi:hypothetical protein